MPRAGRYLSKSNCFLFSQIENIHFFWDLLSSQIFQRMNVSRSIFARTIFDLLSFVWSCISCHELPNTTLLTGFKFTSVFITNFRIYYIFFRFVLNYGVEKSSFWKLIFSISVLRAEIQISWSLLELFWIFFKLSPA